MKLDNTSFQIRDVLVIKHEMFFIVAESNESYPALWRYNPDLNSMSSLFPWVWKASFCSVVIDTLIYVIGGLASFGFFSECSTFDTDGNNWKQIALLNVARRDACGVSKNDEKIFVAGGADVFHNFLDSCEVYNIATNEWQLIASLTVPRYRGKMVLIDGTLYVLGGQVQERYKDKDASVFLDGMVPVECYDEERDQWIDRTRMPIDKIFFNENPKSTDLLSLNVCSVRLLKTFSSESTGLVPVMAGLTLYPRSTNRHFVFVKT